MCLAIIGEYEVGRGGGKGDVESKFIKTLLL